jgi:hypothetical protein
LHLSPGKSLVVIGYLMELQAKETLKGVFSLTRDESLHNKSKSFIFISEKVCCCHEVGGAAARCSEKHPP